MAKEGPYTTSITLHSNASAAATWTNMPSAETFMFGSHRHVIAVDIMSFTQVRLKVNKQATAGAAGSKLMLKYANSFSTNILNYKNIGISEVSVNIDSANFASETNWIDLNGDVFTEGDDIYLAIIGVGGNGTLDPQFGTISVSFH